MRTGLILLAAAAFAATGCTSDPQLNRELQCAGGVIGGAAVGAGAGAAVGTQNPACK